MRQKSLTTMGIIALILPIALCVGIARTNLVDAKETIPGGNQDPVITKSYVEKLISPLNQKIKAQEEMIGLLNSQLNSITGGTLESPKFEVVEVEQGEKLIGGQGTEIILRAGEGTAIIAELGGLQDVTAGVDIQKGNIPRNHLLITPRDDKRGVKVTKDSTFMVRGDYTLE